MSLDFSPNSSVLLAAFFKAESENIVSQSFSISDKLFFISLNALSAPLESPFNRFQSPFTPFEIAIIAFTTVFPTVTIARNPSTKPAIAKVTPTIAPVPNHLKVFPNPFIVLVTLEELGSTLLNDFTIPLKAVFT